MFCFTRLLVPWSLAVRFFLMPVTSRVLGSLDCIHVTEQHQSQVETHKLFRGGGEKKAEGDPLMTVDTMISTMKIHQKIQAVKMGMRLSFRQMSMAPLQGRRPHIRIMEVSPRDGLQNEKKVLPIQLKLELIKRLCDLKLPAIEVGSFVSPKWVPQMASTSEIVSHPILKQSKHSNPELDLSCLIPNLKGFQAFQQSDKDETIDEIAIFVSSTESFSKANLNATISESMKNMSMVVENAKLRGERKRGGPIRVRGYLSCVFGCPFEGRSDLNQVASITRDLIDMGCYEVAISDTIGCGVPDQVEECLELLSRSNLDLDQIGIHCHDTFGTGLANVMIAVKLGIKTVDSSVGGIGGCPYSPGATGNIATEDVVYALETSGYSTGLIPDASNREELLESLKPLVRLGEWINGELGRVNSSRVGKAIMSKIEREREQSI